MPQSHATPPSRRPPYWRRNVRLIVLLLAVWASLTVAPALYTRYLAFEFIGWPFPFWLAAYGAPLAYLVIVGGYAWAMNRADAQEAGEGGADGGEAAQAAAAGPVPPAAPASPRAVGRPAGQDR